MNTHYPGIVNSPTLTLTSGIDDDDTTIEVTGDIGNLPAAPNIFTIGLGEDAETVRYPTDAVLNVFSGVERAFQGVAKAWEAGEYIVRTVTEYDIRALQEDVDSLFTLNTFAAFVYQDGTNTVAVDNSGNILSSVLISAETDDIPIQAAIDYAGNSATDPYSPVLGKVKISSGLYKTTTKINVKYSVTVECAGLGTVFYVGDNDFVEMYGCSSWSGGYVFCGAGLESWDNAAFLFQADKYHNFIYVKSGYIRDVFMGNYATDTTGGKGIWLDASLGDSGETYIYNREFSQLTIENFGIGIYLSTDTETIYTNGITWCDFNNITLNYCINMIREEHLGTEGDMVNNRFGYIKMQAATTPEPPTDVGLYLSGEYEIFDNVSIMDWNSAINSYAIQFTGFALREKVIISLYDESNPLTEYVLDEGLGNIIEVAQHPKGLPVYDVIVYQDTTWTYAISKTGMVLSAIWKGAETDNIPIQAAIDYLEGLSAGINQGYKLLIAAGIYLIDDELLITKPHFISGDGSGITILRSHAATPMINITPVDDAILTYVDGWESRHFCLRDITLDGTTDGAMTRLGTYGVYFGGDPTWLTSNALNCHFENVTFRGFTTYGAYDNTNYGSMYTHCNFVRNGTYPTTAAGIPAALNSGGLAVCGNATIVIGCQFQANSIGLNLRGGVVSNIAGNIIEASWIHGIYTEYTAASYPYTVGTVTDTTHFACAALHDIATAGGFVFVEGRSGSVVESFNNTSNVLTLTDAIAGITAEDSFSYIPYARNAFWISGIINQYLDNTYIESSGLYNEYYPGDPYDCYDVYIGPNCPLVNLRNLNTNSTQVTKTIYSAGDFTKIENLSDNQTKGTELTGAYPLEINTIAAGVLIKGLTISGATASVADGGTITHGLGRTPTWAIVTCSISGESAAATTLGETTITVAIKKSTDGSAGTTQTLYWQCGV